VGKPTLLPATFRNIEEFTLERNTVHVTSVGKPLLIPVTLRNIEELTLRRNPMHVSNVEKTSLIPITFKYMNQLTLERNPMHVSNVEKISLIPVTFEALKELTMERNLLDVSNVEKVFTCPTTLKRHKGTSTSEKTHGYEQFPVTLTNVNSLCRETMSVRNERQSTLYPVILIKKLTQDKPNGCKQCGKHSSVLVPFMQLKELMM
jgi:hypothetical protein